MADGGALWRRRDFTLFWSAQTVSVAGDAFSLVAIPFLVYHLTHSVARMTTLTAVAGAATIVAGVLAGPLVDRFDRRRLMILCDLARLVVYGVVPFCHPVWLLFVLLPLGEAIGMVFQIGYVTAVPNLVERDRIADANSLLYASYAAAGVAGPPLAGLVSGQVGAQWAIGIDAVTYAASAVGLCMIRLRPAAPVPSSARGLLAGARFLVRQPVLRALTVLLTLFIFLTSGLTDVMIFHLQHDLRAGDTASGLALSVAAIGTVAGAAGAAPLRRRIGFGATWIGSVAVTGAAVAVLGLAGNVPTVAVLAAVYLGSAAVGGITSMSLRQLITPDALLGRVTSAFWTVHHSLGPVGAAVLGWAAGRYGVSTAVPLAGVGCVLLAGGALVTPVRQAKPEAAPSTSSR